MEKWQKIMVVAGLVLVTATVLTLLMPIVAGSDEPQVEEGVVEEPEEPEEPAEQRVVPSGESPMLRERVEAGELPPLEERLPRDPMVVEPHDDSDAESIDAEDRYGSP